VFSRLNTVQTMRRRRTLMTNVLSLHREQGW